MKFTQISETAFKEMQMNAGVVLKKFDPTAADSLDNSDIVCTTTGGISVSCVPTFSDLGEDVDNCPNNMMELKQLDSWEVKMGFTALNVAEESIRLALGAADTADGKITPRADLDSGDFADLWWVGDRSDGGWVAVKIENALSTSGFSLQTTKNGKGQLTVELTGHVSISAQDKVPMEFYVTEGTAETAETE